MNIFIEYGFFTSNNNTNAFDNHKINGQQQQKCTNEKICCEYEKPIPELTEEIQENCHTRFYNALSELSAPQQPKNGKFSFK